MHVVGLLAVSVLEQVPYTPAYVSKSNGQVWLWIALGVGVLARSHELTAMRAGLTVCLAIKFHPYEDPKSFLERLCHLERPPGLMIREVSGSEKPYPWVLWSDLVTGIGSMLLLAISWLFVKSTPSRVDRLFRRLQVVSSSLYSLGHGGNDAQKTIGIIWVLLIGAHAIGPKDPVPVWVIVACYVAIALGTMIGGWRIVKTMGQRITKLKPVHGFCAETGGAITLFLATALGIPVSTTHTITGAIVGVGSTRRFSAVKWGVAGRIVWAWILTIPMAGAISALAYIGLRGWMG